MHSLYVPRNNTTWATSGLSNRANAAPFLIYGNGASDLKLHKEIIQYEQMNNKYQLSEKITGKYYKKKVLNE